MDKYTKNLYNEVIFADTDFEYERERLQKEQDKSFLDFFKSRKDQQSFSERKNLTEHQPPSNRDLEISGARNSMQRSNAVQSSFQRKSISGQDGLTLVDTMEDSNQKILV